MPPILLRRSARRWLRVVVLVWLANWTTTASAQTTTYHLHNEASTTANLKQLQTSAPDVASVPIQTANLRNTANGEKLLKEFDTQAGVPGTAGSIPSGSTITFQLWMRKTASVGTLFPRAKLRRNNSAGTSLCTATGTTSITTTLTKYTISCTTSANVILTASDRFYVWAGANMTAGSTTTNFMAELDIEGTLNGNFDSQLSVPNPLPTPTISNLTPSSGGIGQSITVAGTNFGTTQGSSTLKFFNNKTAAATSWSATSITAPVPTGTVTGNVTVTVAGQSSNGWSFTLLPTPTISSIVPGSGTTNTPVTINGTNFGVSQGTSTLKFNGTTAAVTSWIATKIETQVPAGATSGPVVVTVSGVPSAGTSFTIPPAITSLSPSAAAAGETVVITGLAFGASQGASTVTFNGTAATPTTWTNTSISTVVPVGATSGNVVLTVASQASNGSAFTVIVPGSLAGTITRVTGGTAISGASVQALLDGVVKASASTPGSGAYSFSGLYPGSYEVRVTATGFAPELRQGVVVTSSTTATQDVAMYVPGGVSGKVTQADGTTPIQGAAVSVFVGASQKGSASTNATGDYSIAALRPGAYTARASHVGNQTSEQGVVIAESATATKNFSLASATGGSIRYSYDALGRIIQVTDASGDAAIYRYDEVGNIVGIDRVGAAAVAVSGFAPTAGAVGASVTIYGAGFSATPAQNAVLFNGVTAMVTAASTTQLSATVPPSATSGAISVTSPLGSANGPYPFTVLSAAGPPTISGFSPAIGVAGTSIVVNGSNFSAVPADDYTRVNITSTTVSAATTTAVTTLLPLAVGSGPITVTTPSGSAVSSADFFVPPPGFTATDVDFTDRMTIGSSKTVTIGNTFHHGLVTFAATAGQRVSFTTTSTMNGSLRVLTPMLTVVPVPVVFFTAGTTGFYDAITLPATATYTAWVASSGTSTGNTTLTLHDVVDVTTPIVVGGSAVTVTVTTFGQNPALTFSGTSGNRIALRGSNGTIAGQVTGCDVNVRILNPNGSVLVPSACMEGGGFIDTTALPSTGTYKIVVDPALQALGALTLTLYDVPADATASITPAGSSVNVTTTAIGQNAVLTFSGTAGQKVSLLSTNSTYTSSGSAEMSIRAPNMSVIAGPTTMSAEAGTISFLDVVTLPTTGNYTILVNPQVMATGGATLTLYDIPGDVTGSIIPGGSPVSVPIAIPGQNGTLTFSGTASERVSLNVAGSTYAGGVSIAIRNPDTSWLLFPTVVWGTSGFFNTMQLPATGTYTILIDPVIRATGTVSLTLYDVPGDPAALLTIGAAATTLTTTVPGQNASATVAGTNGQQITVRLTGNTFGTVTVYLSAPDTSQLAWTFDSAGSFNLQTVTLPVTGTYTITIDPLAASIGSIGVRVTNP
jgi:YD repeat-containing protein